MTILRFQDRLSEFQWVDAIDPSRDEIELIAEQYGLPAAGVEDCLDPIHLPKYENIEGVNFIIMRTFDEAPAEGPSDVTHLTRKIGLFVDSKRIISIHRNDPKFLKSLRENQWQAYEQSEIPTHLEVLAGVIAGTLESYRPAISEFQAQLEKFTTHIFEDQSSYENLKEKFNAKKQINVYKRMIKLIEDVLHKLKPMFGETNRSLLQNLTETAAHLYFYAQELEDNITGLMNLQMSLSTHQVNEIMRILTMVSVFFMPVTFIVGIYGMNFDHMPELRMKLGYPYVLALMVMVSLATYAWFIKKGWTQKQ